MTEPNDTPPPQPAASRRTLVWAVGGLAVVIGLIIAGLTGAAWWLYRHDALATLRHDPQATVAPLIARITAAEAALEALQTLTNTNTDAIRTNQARIQARPPGGPQVMAENRLPPAALVPLVTRLDTLEGRLAALPQPDQATPGSYTALACFLLADHTLTALTQGDTAIITQFWPSLAACSKHLNLEGAEPLTHAYTAWQQAASPGQQRVKDALYAATESLAERTPPPADESGDQPLWRQVLNRFVRIESLNQADQDARNQNQLTAIISLVENGAYTVAVSDAAVLHQQFEAGHDLVSSNALEKWLSVAGPFARFTASLERIHSALIGRVAGAALRDTGEGMRGPSGHVSTLPSQIDPAP